MLLTQYQTNQNNREKNNDKNTNEIQDHDHKLTQKQDMINIAPFESELNQYMKKIFLQTFDSNSHIDKIRINYIKLKNKKNTNNSINNDFTQSKHERSILLNESVKNTGISDYLRQLQEDSKKTNLPTEIINNKTLCSLYQKLDLFENNLISQHQKEQKTNNKKIEKQLEQDDEQLTIKLTKDQLQWYNEYKQALYQAKLKQHEKQVQFNQLKEKLKQTNVIQEIQKSNIIKISYIESLIKQTQKNLLMKREKLNNLEQQLMTIESKQIKSNELNQRVQELTEKIKELMCQIYRKQNLFC